MARRRAARDLRHRRRRGPGRRGAGQAMKIGVDATAWQNNRGYGRHERALLRALLELDRESHYTFFMDSKELAELVPPRAEVRMLAASAATSTAASANS